MAMVVAVSVREFCRVWAMGVRSCRRVNLPRGLGDSVDGVGFAAVWMGGCCVYITLGD